MVYFSIIIVVYFSDIIYIAFAGRASFYDNDTISTSIPIGTEAETRVIKNLILITS